jgi:hypothetical protein
MLRLFGFSGAASATATPEVCPLLRLTLPAVQGDEKPRDAFDTGTQKEPNHGTSNQTVYAKDEKSSSSANCAVHTRKQKRSCKILGQVCSFPGTFCLKEL